MATVLLGNTAPVEAPIGTTIKLNEEVVSAPDPVAAPAAAKTVVFIDTADHDAVGKPVPLDKKLAEVRNAFAVHSSGDAAWVEGHDDFFNEAVAQSFGCPVGRPDDWDAPEAAQEGAERPFAGVAAAAVADVEVEAQEA